MPTQPHLAATGSSWPSIAPESYSSSARDQWPGALGDPHCSFLGKCSEGLSANVAFPLGLRDTFIQILCRLAS